MKCDMESRRLSPVRIPAVGKGPGASCFLPSIAVLVSPSRAQPRSPAGWREMERGEERGRVSVTPVVIDHALHNRRGLGFLHTKARRHEQTMGFVDRALRMARARDRAGKGGREKGGKEGGRG